MHYHMMGTTRTPNTHLFEILNLTPYHAGKLSVADFSRTLASWKISPSSQYMKGLNSTNDSSII